jgi:hypothetical protein
VLSSPDAANPQQARRPPSRTKGRELIKEAKGLK